MRRLVRLLTASAVVATVGVLVPAPADAAVDECTSSGTLTLGGLGFAIPTTWRTTTFSLTINGASCVSCATTITATGTVSGACFSSSGAGVATVFNPHQTPQDHKFAFVNEGTRWIATGEVASELTVIEDPPSDSLSTAAATPSHTRLHPWDITSLHPTHHKFEHHKVRLRRCR